MSMMRSAPTLPDAEPVTATVDPAARLLDIDAEKFRTTFARGPFLIGHHLVDHPLFQLPRLVELAQRLPEKNIEYNAGKLPVSLDPSQTPRTGLSVEETIRRIEECQSWMVLKYVENDPEYRDLLVRCLAEVKEHSEAITPGMVQPEGFIFITSPGSVTPYHMDPELNFLLQIRGSKTVYQFDGTDRSIVTEEDLERFYCGAHRNMKFNEAWREKAWVFDLQPGAGLHFPVAFPHWVQNGPAVSISFSITFRTPVVERTSIIHRVNARLRRWGLRPTPVGQRPWADGLKFQAYRAWRRVRRVAGKTTE